MKAFVALQIFALLVSTSGAKLPEKQVYAPELFGTSAMRTTSTGPRTFTGSIVNGWVSFRIVGTVSAKTPQLVTGYLVQTKGPIIQDRTCPTCPDYPAGQIRFVMWLGDGEFQGRIYFRGHWRKFCGGVDFIPDKCMLR